MHREWAAMGAVYVLRAAVGGCGYSVDERGELRAARPSVNIMRAMHACTHAQRIPADLSAAADPC